MRTEVEPGGSMGLTAMSGQLIHIFQDSSLIVCIIQANIQHSNCEDILLQNLFDMCDNHY